jgi:formylglycine-generating enzyme required for sulfatase activity
MSDAVRQQLHELATAYAAGELHQSAYRARRAQLLDALAGLPPVTESLESTRPRVITPVPPQPSGSYRAPPVNLKPPPTPAPGAAPPAQRRGWWIGLAAILLVGAAGALWWQARTRPGALAAASAPTAPASSSTPTGADPATLVADFLSRGDWSDTALSQFNASWWRLSDAEVAAILTAPDSQDLRTAISAHLRERSALDPSAPIVLLARNLNVEIPAGTVTGYAPAAAAVSVTGEATGTPRVAAAKPATSEAPPAPAVAPANNAATNPASNPASNPPNKPPTIAPPAPRTVAGNPVVAPATSATAVTSAANPQTSADPCRSARRGLCHDSLPGGLEGPKLVLIGAGAFEMGSMAHPEEQPVHAVTIAKTFAVTINEISDAEYRAYCTQPGHECPKQPWEGEKRPVVNVSWSDAVDYAKWLSQATGQHYRLPTEAEWEYFARAGTHGDFWSDKPLDLSQAYFASAAAAPETPAELSQGGFSPNPWGLLHVAGNVREWVADAWLPNYDAAPADGSARTGADGLRVVRGGSYHDPLPKLRSAAREKLAEQTRDAYTGIRLVRELAP